MVEGVDRKDRPGSTDPRAGRAFVSGISWDWWVWFCQGVPQGVGVEPTGAASHGEPQPGWPCPVSPGRPGIGADSADASGRAVARRGERLRAIPPWAAAAPPPAEWTSGFGERVSLEACLSLTRRAPAAMREFFSCPGVLRGGFRILPRSMAARVAWAVQAVQAVRAVRADRQFRPTPACAAWLP